jgi:hypothetical protein
MDSPIRIGCLAPNIAMPLTTVDNPVLTVIPGICCISTRDVVPPDDHDTNEPAVVVRERGRSRLAYFPGDIEATMWLSGHTDLSLLLQNAIRWVAGKNVPVTIEGKGLIEAFAWETEPGFAIHVLNYTNPNAHRGWVREFYPIGEQRVQFRLPAGRRVTRVRTASYRKRHSISRSGGIRWSLRFRQSAVTKWRRSIAA